MFPAEPIMREAAITDNYRWTLKRAWGAGPCIAWIGLNPSTADGKRDDPTMHREIGFSFRWGFGSLVKLNIYPFISSSPAAMLEWRETFRGDKEFDYSAFCAFLENLDTCTTEISKVQMVMAAWGNGADADEVDTFISEIELELERKLVLHCLGKTGCGAPIHPLARGQHRVPDQKQPELWRAA